MSLGHELRALMGQIIETTHGVADKHTDELFALAAKADRMHNNLSTLGGHVAAACDSLVSHPTTAIVQLRAAEELLTRTRHALGNFPPIPPLTREQAIADVDTVRARLDDRLDRTKQK